VNLPILNVFYIEHQTHCSVPEELAKLKKLKVHKKNEKKEG
jgi:hypothetical protein